MIRILDKVLQKEICQKTRRRPLFTSLELGRLQLLCSGTREGLDSNCMKLFVAFQHDCFRIRSRVAYACETGACVRSLWPQIKMYACVFGMHASVLFTYALVRFCSILHGLTTLQRAREAECTNAEGKNAKLVRQFARAQ